MGQDVRAFLRIPGSWRLFTAMLAYGCAQGILRPMNAIYLAQHVGLTKLQVSVLVSVSLLTDMAVTLGTGIASDRVRHKRTLPILAAVLCMAGLLWYLHADSFLTALGAMVLATSPAGVIMGQLFAMARSHFTVEAPAIAEMAIVWLRAMMSCGFFLGLLLGAELFTAVSFAGVLWGNFVSYALILLLLAGYRERTSGYRPLPQSAIPFQWIGIFALLILLCGDAIRGLYFPLVVDALYHSPALVSHLWSVQAIFELLWMTVAGYAAARYGTVRVIRIAAALGFGVYAVYALHPALPWLVAMQPVHSFYVSVLYSVGMSYVQRMFLTRTGFGSSLYLFLSQTASLLGYLTPNLIPGYSPHIFFVPMGLVVVSSLLLGWVKEHEQTAKPTEA